MKKIVSAIALLALIAGPAIAQRPSRDSLYYVQLRDGSRLYSSQLSVRINNRLEKVILLGQDRFFPIDKVDQFRNSQGLFVTVPGSAGTDIYHVDQLGPRLSLFSKPVLDELQGTIAGSRHTEYYFRRSPGLLMQPLTYHGLMDAMADNPSAIQELKRTHTVLITGWTATGVGVGLGTAGIIITATNDSHRTLILPPATSPFNNPQPATISPAPAPSPLIYIGSALFLGGIIYAFTAIRHLHRSVNYYNYNP